MTTFISAGLLIVATVLLLPTLSDLLSLLVAGFRAPDKPRRETEKSPSPRFLFLIPAHDEEGIIGPCVTSMVEMNYPPELRHVCVIADNCSDRTPEVAEDAGADVLERHDLDLRGKPYALEWALQQVDLTGFDAVVVVDADTVVERDFAGELAKDSPWVGRAAQVYCGVENPDESALTRMSQVFANARYEYAFPLKQAASINVPLMGNGMCFGADLLQDRGWEAFSICEDWEVYGLYTIEGIPISLNRRARLLAQEARTLQQSGSQRERWAAGKITVLAGLSLPLLTSNKIGFRQKLDAFAELTHFGPVVHVALVVLMSIGTILLPLPGKALILVLLWVGVLRIALLTLLAIRHEANPVRTLASFAFLPIYAVWRLAVQLSSIRMLGKARWMKTTRNS